MEEKLLCGKCSAGSFGLRRALLYFFADVEREFRNGEAWWEDPSRVLSFHFQIFAAFSILGLEIELERKPI
jgi:hypothetical protein